MCEKPSSAEGTEDWGTALALGFSASIPAPESGKSQDAVVRSSLSRCLIKCYLTSYHPIWFQEFANMTKFRPHPLFHFPPMFLAAGMWWQQM